jgi:hypothetical protein
MMHLGVGTWSVSTSNAVVVGIEHEILYRDRFRGQVLSITFLKARK